MKPYVSVSVQTEHTVVEVYCLEDDVLQVCELLKRIVVISAQCKGGKEPIDVIHKIAKTTPSDVVEVDRKDKPPYFVPCAG